MLASVFTLFAFIACTLAKSNAGTTPTGEPCEVIKYSDKASKYNCGAKAKISGREKGIIHTYAEMRFCNVDKGRSDYSVKCGETCTKTFNMCTNMCLSHTATLWDRRLSSSFLTAKC